MSIKENIIKIKKRISEVAEGVGRDPDEVRLIGVTKQVNTGRIIEAIKSGLTEFGENYAQDFRDKYRELEKEKNNTKWHFIGHLQKNKIKYLIGKVELIHSINSSSLAEEINKRAGRENKKVNILIEIKSSEQESKTGVNLEEAETLISKISKLDNIEIKGLMTMAPYFENPEKSRSYFKSLREFRDRIKKNFPEIKELSMGMSGDFEVAIEEGSTMVRIGTAIFGEREY